MSAGEPADVTVPKPVVAKTIEQVKEAVVKLVIPQSGKRTSFGTGFLINNRGWVATSNHVIQEISTASRAATHDGRQYTLAGIVARVPERDLAIVKLADIPRRVTILDINRQGNPQRRSAVMSCGHPHNIGLAFVKGSVNRVATSQELLSDRANPVLAKMQAPATLVWIQHDAKIAQGNSGGPLLDNDCRVLGVNTFVNELFGYAVHVRYLQALATASSDDRLQPIPQYKEHSAPAEATQPPRARTPVSPRRLQKLFDSCAGFGWKPERQKQYNRFAKFANLMTHAKHGQPSPTAKETARASVDKADELFRRLKEARWTAEQVAAVNKFSAAQLDKTDQGVVAFANTIGNASGALLMQTEGTNKRFVVKVSPTVAREPPGSRWLVLGVVSRHITQVNDSQGQKSQCRVLGAHYLFKIQ